MRIEIPDNKPRASSRGARMTAMIHLDTAKQIALREIEARKNASRIFSRFFFSPMEIEDENERFWVFAAGSEEAFDEGVVPNAIYVCVDKFDGHVWSRQEQEQFHKQKSSALSLPIARVA